MTILMPSNNKDTPKYSFDSEKRLYSNIYDDIYFSISGAEEESEHVFINGNNLKERFASQNNFIIAEAGFGTGLNFLMSMKEWAKHFSDEKALTYIGFESTPLTPEVLSDSHAAWTDLLKYSKLLLNIYQTTPLTSTTLYIPNFNITLILFIGDINTEIRGISRDIDAWFLDGFSPAKNPDMWSKELFASMARKSKQGETTLATYSCARAVREGLAASGFKVQKNAGFGMKRYMLTGSY